MKLSRTTALIPIACLAIGGCRLSNPLAAKAPTGQVVATVYGHEITVRDLDAEMGGRTYPDAATRKRAQQVAIQNIIDLKILDEEAAKQGIDKTPDFALQKQRAIDSLMAQMLLKKVALSVPAPTREEAERFVTDNPDVFAQRKIFTLDQLVFPRPSDPALFAEIHPMSTLEQVKAALDAHNIPSRMQTTPLDAVGANPKIVTALMNLKPTDLPMEASGPNIIVNHVASIRVLPFSGEPAVQYATMYLRQQHAQQAVQNEGAQLITAAKGHWAVNAAYRPSPSARPAVPPASPAPGAPPAAANAAGKGD